MPSYYIRAKKAKASLKAKNLLGWPRSENGITALFDQLPEDEQLTILCGRFVKMWDGNWQFSFPTTKRVVEAMEGLLPKRKEILFKEDEG